MSKNPSLGSIPGDISPALRDLLGAMKEAIEVRNGQRGDALDTGVTLRMLGKLDGIRVQLPGQGGVSDPGLIWTNPAMDSTPPPPVANLQAVGALASIILSWQLPTYPGHAYTEVWRADVDDLGQASKVGMTPGTVYADTVGGGRVAYYWARAVSRANVIGAYNAVAGTRGETSLDPGYVMDILTGDSTTPFVIQAEPTVINGFPVPAGTYIRDAFIKVGTIGRAMIGLAAIDDARIANLSAEKITAGFIDVARLQAGTITGDKIAANTITADKLVANSITAGQLAAGSVTAGVIAAGAVTTDKLDAGAVTAAKIAAGAVTATTIQSGAVTADKVSASAITADKISVSSLSAISGNLGSIVVGNANIADAAISFAKIGDAQIDTIKIAGEAVTIPRAANGGPVGGTGYLVTLVSVYAPGGAASVAISGVVSTYAVGSACHYGIYRDGILLKEWIFPEGSDFVQVPVAWQDAYGGGGTYSIMANFPSTTTASATITCIGCKR